MKTVLAFGDSLTWGAIPGSDERHGFEDRWPNVLERELGGGVRVVENGLNGRTTVHEDRFSPHRNGADHLPGLLEAHTPLDLVIIMLGTNDLNFCYGGRAFEAMLGMDRLVEIVQHHPYTRGMSAPPVLLVAPPHLREAESEPDYDEYFGAAIAESKKTLRALSTDRRRPRLPLCGRCRVRRGERHRRVSSRCGQYAGDRRGSGASRTLPFEPLNLKANCYGRYFF